ncbi:MAG: glycosyltransferase family 4 protein [Chlamydiae bacterium]|nr:glycosyltransferase family 4 protein [Chlamydiota bacterium]
MKTVLVHDWLINEGGAEKVLEAILELFPSPIYTLLYAKQLMQRAPFHAYDVRSSFLQKIPLATRHHRMLLPLFPKAIKALDVSGADLVISSSHAVAKGVHIEEGQKHICYCHTPMRYLWDLEELYLHAFPAWQKKYLRKLFRHLRKWDVQTANNVNLFLANSAYVAKRIFKHYGKEATVVYPPVDTEAFFISPQKESYFITHARLVSYKRIDLLVEAFSFMPDKRLLIIGEGPEGKRLKKLATKNVEFLGFQPQERLAELLSKARAYLFCAEEDFGIGVVEAQSSGLPVIALGKGGALETIQKGLSGVFFQDATLSSFMETLHLFEEKEPYFDPFAIRTWSLQFSKERFLMQFSRVVSEFLNSL